MSIEKEIDILDEQLARGEIDSRTYWRELRELQLGVKEYQLYDEQEAYNREYGW